MTPVIFINRTYWPNEQATAQLMTDLAAGLAASGRQVSVVTSVEALRSYVYRAGGSRRIEVFDGMNRPPPYAAASICLLPSHSENFGMVVAEALAAGVPALVTDSTPWKLLEAARAGWCVPWSDFGPALQSALAETPDSLQARGSTARAWAHATFAWSNTARTLLGFYEQLRSARGEARNPA